MAGGCAAQKRSIGFSFEPENKSVASPSWESRSYKKAKGGKAEKSAMPPYENPAGGKQADSHFPGLTSVLAARVAKHERRGTDRH
jgi:hypothetical protein